MTIGNPAPPPTQDALAALRSLLEYYDLPTEVDWAWGELVAGSTQTQVLQALRQRDAYLTRFAGMAKRQAAGLTPIDEGTYLTLERQYRQIFQSAGFPREYMDSTYLSDLIGFDRSPDEVRSIVTDAYVKVTQAPPEVRQAWGAFFGAWGDSAFAAMMVDPDMSETALVRMANEAYVGGIGETFGFDANFAFAEQVAARGLQNNAAQFYGQAAQRRGYATETISEQQDLTEGDLLQASFGLNDTSIEAFRKRQAQRQAAFAGNVGTNVDQSGVLGLGAAGT